MKVADLNKYKDSCYTALSRDLTEFEKNFLLLSGGLLAFSTTFIKDIVKVPETNYLGLLFFSWFLIICSIGLMMYTFLKSADASDNLWKLVDDFLIDNKFLKQEDDLTEIQWLNIKSQVSDILITSKTTLRRLRKYAVNFFIVGTFVFSVFVSLNLMIEKNNAIQKEIQHKDSINSKV